MLRIGIVGGAKKWHGMTFAMLFNGYDKRKSKRYKWPCQYSSLVGGGARVTHIWDPSRKDAEEVAEVCDIENVLRRKEDMLGLVDGVVLADDCTMKHQKRAPFFLKAGLPTFIDKPLTTDIAEANRLVNLAVASGAPMMSCSSIRYARELEELRKQAAKWGDILTGNAVCANDLLFYGIHALEPLYALVGPGVKSVRNVGRKGRDIVAVKLKDGRVFTVTVINGMSGMFRVTLYGTKGWGSMQAMDADYFYGRMMKEFVKMVKTGKQPIPLEQTLEVIKTLIKSVQSRKGNRELRV